MRILITAGPTHEPIDPVRYIGNRSSGKLGAALAAAALDAKHHVTLILGPVTTVMPANVSRIDVQTAAEMHQAVLAEFPSHDVLIMAAAVADYRPKQSSPEKLRRHGTLNIECEATEDIVASASRSKRSDQRTVAFSLESAGNIQRAREKLVRKHVDLIIFNPVETMHSETIEAVLIYPDGHEEARASLPKSEFAPLLIARVEEMFPGN